MSIKIEIISGRMSAKEVDALKALLDAVGAAPAGSYWSGEADMPVMASRHNDDIGECEPVDVGVTAPALDSAGIPWDERIHSSTKGTNKDGTWSRRRNTPDDLYNSVMAELKGCPTAPPVTDASTGPDGSSKSPTPPEATIETMVTLPEASTSAEVAEAFSTLVVPPPPPAPSATEVNPVEIMKRVTRLQTAGRLPEDALDAMLLAANIDSLAKMFTAPAENRALLLASLEALE